MYLTPATTAFPRITLGALISKSVLDKGRNREEIERKYNGENIDTLNHFGIYKLSIYKNSWKNDCKKNVKEEGWILWKYGILCNNCKCFSTLFLILLKYKWNNEIRTARATTAITVIITIEKKNEMIRKVSVEIKGFIKRYVVLPLHYVTLHKLLKRFFSSFRCLRNWNDLSL